MTQEVLDEDCPKCKAHKLSIRLGRRGRFIGCSGFPECDYTRNLDGSGDSAEGPAKFDIGVDPKTKMAIQLLQGPFGWYFQLGEAEGDKKPKRVSLPKNVAPEAADLAVALKMLALPRDLGTHPETGKKVIANIGRFGPYVNHDGQFKSIPKDENVFDIGLERAVALLAEPRSAGGRGALRVLGKHPDDGQSVSLYAGKYGPYVKHGKVNATIPDKDAIDTLTLDEALAHPGGQVEVQAESEGEDRQGQDGQGQDPAREKGRLASRPGGLPLPRRSDVEVGHAQRVVLDELAPRLHVVAHERREDLVGADRILDLHLQQDALGRVHRRLPELLGVHLAQPLVALDRHAALRLARAASPAPP